MTASSDDKQVGADSAGGDSRPPVGSAPGTSVDGTLIKNAIATHASWIEATARASSRPSRSAPTWSAGRLCDLAAICNQVMLTAPVEDFETIIGEVDEFFGPHVPYMMSSPWPTPDLRKYRLQPVGRFPLMIRFPKSHHPDAVDIRITEVSDSEQLAVAEEVMIAGYPVPELRRATPGSLMPAGILRGALRVWLVWLGGQAVATAAAHVHANLNLVLYVATLPSVRGHGAGTAVTWAATQALPESVATLVASDAGRPVYERMGYVAIDRWTVWERSVES